MKAYVIGDKVLAELTKRLDLVPTSAEIGYYLPGDFLIDGADDFAGIVAGGPYDVLWTWTEDDGGQFEAVDRIQF